MKINNVFKNRKMILVLFMLGIIFCCAGLFIVIFSPNKTVVEESPITEENNSNDDFSIGKTGTDYEEIYDKFMKNEYDTDEKKCDALKHLLEIENDGNMNYICGINEDLKENSYVVYAHDIKTNELKRIYFINKKTLKYDYFLLSN